MLYLSRFILERKSDYYRLLRDVTEAGEWEAWVLYMIEAVETTAIRFVEEAGIATRQTASKYLQRLEEIGLLTGVRAGREIYYLNEPLLRVLAA